MMKAKQLTLTVKEEMRSVSANVLSIRATFSEQNVVILRQRL